MPLKIQISAGSGRSASVQATANGFRPSCGPAPRAHLRDLVEDDGHEDEAVGGEEREALDQEPVGVGGWVVGRARARARARSWCRKRAGCAPGLQFLTASRLIWWKRGYPGPAFRPGQAVPSTYQRGASVAVCFRVAADREKGAAWQADASPVAGAARRRLRNLGGDLCAWRASRHVRVGGPASADETDRRRGRSAAIQSRTKPRAACGLLSPTNRRRRLYR